VRIDFNWDVVEPAEGQWSWALVDGIVDAAKQRGLKVYASLGYTPAWASSGDRLGDGPGNDVPIADKYRAYVVAVVTRYRDRIDVFGSWNEPNIAGFWEGSRQEWVDVAYRPFVEAVQATCPTCQCAGPEIATIGSQYPAFIADGLAAAVPTILSAHIYATFPEDDFGAGLTKDSFYNKLDAHRVVGIYEGPLSIRESASAAGHDELPVWITEVGKEANASDTAQLDAQRVYVQRVLDAMDSRAWWGGTIFYEGSEEHPGGMYPNVHWGLALRTSAPDATPLDDFARKPAWTYLQQRLASSSASDAGATNDAVAGVDPGGDGAVNGGASTGSPTGCGCGAAPGIDALVPGTALALLLARSRRRGRRGSSNAHAV
jgi:hypothetical protein